MSGRPKTVYRGGAYGIKGRPHGSFDIWDLRISSFDPVVEERSPPSPRGQRRELLPGIHDLW